MIHGLDRARWNVLSPYLDEALDRPAAARPGYLEGLRARDPVLAADLEALLADYDRIEAEKFLESAPARRPTLAGQTLGAYTLRELIGQGGMGSVWRAERSDGRYEGVAAVKLLNASLVGLESGERFRREGNILARLRHPHIAHLIDAGVSPSGQPYLVLEHVDGDHLDEYCDRRHLGIEARVRLFLDVLAAVSHAHANLVVHRDLKPSNVLVGRDGAVKLLDFGVAKLLEPDPVGSAVTLTRAGDSALTPAYAAPEQLTGGDITTATDVYALGALLYGLLAGRHPAEEALRSSPGELVRAILDHEPPRLSAAAMPSAVKADLARTRAANRGTTPERLRRALRGDLETIVARALKKDPAERYASVVALADDLRRHLAHAPIGARPDTVRYRVAKFVRRHRLPVALAGVLLLALAAGLAGTIWQARAAARERDLAWAHLERAESINEFTAYVLGQAVPGGEPVRVREILMRAERLADQRSQHDPALAVDLLVSIGGIYVVRDENDNAQRTLKRAYDLSQALPDPATRAKATCAWARAVGLSGDHESALRLIDAGLALAAADERLDGVAATCLLDRGSIAMDAESGPLVSASAQEALRRLGRRPGAFPELRATALQMVAVGHRMAGEAADADRMFAQAVDQLRLIGREDSLDAAVLLHNWAINAALTSPVEALELNRRVVGIFEGDTAESVPIPSLLNYAFHLNRMARHREARGVLERVQLLARRHGNLQALGSSTVQLAAACRELGDMACARESLRSAEAGVPGAFPPGHRVRGDLAREQALLAEAEGRYPDAHRLMLEAFEIHRRLADKHPTQIDTLLELSRLELRQRSPVEAEARAREALAVGESFRGGKPFSSWVGRSLLAVGAARQAQGDAAGARETLARAAEHMTPTLGARHPALIEARDLLAAGAAQAR